MTRRIEAVCVYCGSSSGSDPIFTQAATQLAQSICERKWKLVYGGGSTGLMGACAREMTRLGGKVHGVIPQALVQRERRGEVPESTQYGQTTVVGDMHTRKRMMGQMSQAFVALPGGFGTCEELFEVITWNQLGLHSCPIVIFNVNGFYDGLMQFIRQAVGNGFISADNQHIVVEAKTAEEVIHAIENYKLPEGRFTLNWCDQSPLPQSANGTNPFEI